MSPGTINIRDEKVLYSTFWAIPMMDDRLDRSSVTVSVWLFVALFCSSSTPVQQHFLHTTPSHGSDQSGCVTPGGGSKSMAAQIENGGMAYWRLLLGNSTADSVNCMLLLFHLTCIRALASKPRKHWLTGSLLSCSCIVYVRACYVSAASRHHCWQAPELC